MNSSRLEAFSDGVIAIIITIMVLELKVPRGANVDALAPLIPNFLSYVLSFIYVGIYWNNHHHMLHTVEEVTGRIGSARVFIFWWRCYGWCRIAALKACWFKNEKRVPLERTSRKSSCRIRFHSSCGVSMRWRATRG
jgi:hypothetical protein